MARMLRAVCAAAGLAAAAGFTMWTPVGRSRTLRSAVTTAPERVAPAMSTIEPGAKCLVLGSGWIQLLTAKSAALAGYETYVFTSQDPEPAKELIFSDACPRDSIPLNFLQISDKEACESVLAEIEAVLVASDADMPVKPGVLNTVIPEGPDEKSKVKKIVFMSRNGCSGREGVGEGLGFLIKGAKDFSNPDIWAGGDEYISAYTALEEKVRAKAAAVGADFTIVRAGTLKGGGPGLSSTSDGRFFPRAEDSLAAAIYKTGPAGRNWRAVFDTSTQGVDMNPGDNVKIPAGGWFSIKSAISFDVEPGDSSRLGVALAMVQSLSQPKAANTDFSVSTADGRDPPKAEEWNKLFAGL